MPYYPFITVQPAGGTTTLPYLSGVNVVPTGVNLSSGSTQQFYASGTMSGTNGLVSGALPNSFLSWSSSNTALVTVNQSGLATIVSGTVAGSVAYVSASVLGDVVGTAFVTATMAQSYSTVFNPNSSSIMDHVYFTGGGIAVSSGSAWTTNGTLSFNTTASFQYADGFSDSNYFRANANTAFAHRTDNFTWAIIVRYNTIGNGTVMSTFNGSAGIAMQAYSGYSIFAGSGANSLIPAGSPTDTKWYIFMGGEDGGTFKGQVNQQSIGTFSPTYTNSGISCWMGRGNDGGYSLSAGAIMEAIYIDRAATSASFADLYTQAAAKLNLG